jgi:hypothetical protein
MACCATKHAPSRKPPLDQTVIARVIDFTASPPPSETTHWTGAAMAKAVGISASSVQRIWHAHGLKPGQVREFKLSNDPDKDAVRSEAALSRLIPLVPWRCSALFNGHSPAPVRRVTCAAGLSNLTGCIEGGHHRVDAARHARPAEPAQ